MFVNSLNTSNINCDSSICHVWCELLPMFRVKNSIVSYHGDCVKRITINVAWSAFMFFSIQTRQTIEEEEKDDQMSSKLLNGHIRECNNYFLWAYIKLCFEKKNKKNRNYLQVLKTLLIFLYVLKSFIRTWFVFILAN